MRIRVIAVGRPALTFARDGIAEYEKRLKPLGAVEFTWVKPGKDAAETTRRQLAAAGDAALLVLDERGEALDTRRMAVCLADWRDSGMKSLAILIGGADGHLPETRAAAKAVWSLGRLTLQHEIALLVWAEQLYRIHSLWSGSPYHRD